MPGGITYLNQLPVGVKGGNDMGENIKVDCKSCTSSAEYCRGCINGDLFTPTEATEDHAPSGQAEFDWLVACGKVKAKAFINANVWDGEDRAGATGDSARFTPDELQELIDELVDHLCN